jgi:glycosyltransferase involved in cell wall biosynthesis
MAETNDTPVRPVTASPSNGQPGPGALIPQLSAMMPAYNEQEILPQSLAEAVDCLSRIAATWELVVVDDGSTDRTPDILAEWSAREPRIRVVTVRPNQGYSKALIRGFHECRYLTVFYTDADCQFDLAEIPRLYPFLQAADMVAGYRVGRQDPWVRFLTSAVYNRLQGWALGIRVRDVNCAFKLFRRSFFEVVDLSSDGFLIDAELYARAQRAGLRWVQQPVTHRPRTGGTTTVRVATIRQTLRELWRLRRSL